MEIFLNKITRLFSNSCLPKFHMGKGRDQSMWLSRPNRYDLVELKVYFSQKKMCQITILSRKFEFPPYNITLRHFGTLLFSGLPMMI